MPGIYWIDSRGCDVLQAAKNYHAMLAARALGRLAGVLSGGLASPPNVAAQEALTKLLTPSLAARLAEPDPQPLLELLNSSVQTPQVLLLTLF